MIVCSKRVFLNVVTQMFKADVLLNADYYLPDSNSSTKTFVNNSTGINEYGQVYRSSTVDYADEAMGPYHIKKNDVLDIGPYIIKVIVGTSDGDFVDPTEEYIKHLNKPDVLWSTYNFLFRNQLTGNGLQIMIFEDHKTLWKYGNIICQYLSINFGCNIIYVDKAVVDICDGHEKYVGDKRRGEQMIKYAADYDTLSNFHQAVSMSQAFNTDHNIMTFLQGLEFDELCYLHDLLFPEAKLPPGNYTEDHVRQIICGRVMDSVGYKSGIGDAAKNQIFSNLMVHDWQSVLSEFDNAETAEELFGYEEPGSDTGLF